MGKSPSNRPLSFTVTAAGSDTVLVVVGELDIYTSAWLADAVGVLASNGRSRLILDVAGLEFCDAIGLGTLVRCRRIVGDHDGWLHLTGTQPRLSYLLRVTGLAGLIETLPDRSGTPGAAVPQPIAGA